MYANHTSLTQYSVNTKILEKLERREYKEKKRYEAADMMGARVRGPAFIPSEPQVVTKTPDGVGDLKSRGDLDPCSSVEPQRAVRKPERQKGCLAYQIRVGPST